MRIFSRPFRPSAHRFLLECIDRCISCLSAVARLRRTPVWYRAILPSLTVHRPIWSSSFLFALLNLAKKKIMASITGRMAKLYHPGKTP